MFCRINGTKKTGAGFISAASLYPGEGGCIHRLRLSSGICLRLADFGVFPGMELFCVRRNFAAGLIWLRTGWGQLVLEEKIAQGIWLWKEDIWRSS